MEKTTIPSRPMAVHQSRCVRVRNRHVACDACVAACPAGAISCGGNVVSVDASACCGCGACVTACPTGVFEPTAYADDELYRSCVGALEASGGQEAVIACGNAEAAQAGRPCAVVPCLSRVDQGLIATLAALGATRVELVCGDCGACASKNGAKNASETIRSVRDLLGSLGCEVELACTSRPVPDRRTAARDGRAAPMGVPQTCTPRARSPKATGGEVVRLAKVHPRKGTLPQHLPDGRRRLIKAMAVLRKRGRIDGDAVLEGPWGRVQVDPGACTTCRACTVFCPTGALSRFVDDDGSSGICHVAGLCVGCGVCEAVCGASALHLRRSAPLADVLAGRRERFVVKPPAHPNGEPDSVLWRIKELSGFTDLALQGIVSGRE